MKTLLTAFPVLGGWKTNAAAVGLLLTSVGGLLSGTHDVDTAVQGLLTGLGIWGIGHKVEKATSR